MARKPRVYYPGALYHVILRGNDGRWIFYDDHDRIRFYSLVQEGIERFGHRIHAFCLMNTHVHLAIQVGEISLSRIIQNLSFRYTRWINWRYHRTGHLFQGRYKAVLVDKDAYLLELTRYLHLNPVRSGMVMKPEDYRWSGHLAYLGLDAIPWITTDWVLGQFSRSLSAARKAYKKFIMEGKGVGWQEEYHRGSDLDSRILGDDRFMEKVLGREAKIGMRSRLSLEEVIQKVCQQYEVPDVDLISRGKDHRASEIRGVIAWLILEGGVGRLTELGKVTGRDVTTLSSLVRRLRMRAKRNEQLAVRVKGLLKAVSNNCKDASLTPSSQLKE